jgi:hypothetical protein
MTNRPDKLDKMLHAITSPVHFEGLTPEPTDVEVQFAFSSAALIRHRFTLGDLSAYLHWDQETLWAQLKKVLDTRK